MGGGGISDVGRCARSRSRTGMHGSECSGTSALVTVGKDASLKYTILLYTSVQCAYSTILKVGKVSSVAQSP